MKIPHLVVFFFTIFGLLSWFPMQQYKIALKKKNVNTSAYSQRSVTYNNNERGGERKVEPRAKNQLLNNNKKLLCGIDQAVRGRWRASRGQIDRNPLWSVPFHKDHLTLQGIQRVGGGGGGVDWEIGRKDMGTRNTKRGMTGWGNNRPLGADMWNLYPCSETMQNKTDKIISQSGCLG